MKEYKLNEKSKDHVQGFIADQKGPPPLNNLDALLIHRYTEVSYLQLIGLSRKWQNSEEFYIGGLL